MTIEQAIEQISGNYAPLSAELKTEMAGLCTLRMVEKGTELAREGQFADTTYYILKGSARAYYLKNGKAITDWFAFENSFISVIDSFFRGLPSANYLEALEPGIFLEFTKPHADLLTEKYRDFDFLGKKAVTITMLELQQRVLSLQFESAQQKYDNLLRLRPDITQRVSLTHIASYLGITLETLSRIRNPGKRI